MYSEMVGRTLCWW